MTVLLNLQGIAKNFSERWGVRKVINNLYLEIQKGERIALVGPNGSGKTTLLRILLGVETPDAGQVITNEKTYQDVGYIPQDYRNALLPWFNLGKNLRLGKGDADHMLQRYAQVASEFHFDLNLSRRVSDLSGGEQQLFLLVRTLVQEPVFLVLDEPMSAIDYGRKELIRNYLGQYLYTHNVTVVFASHEFDDAVLLSDRVLVLERESGGVKAQIPVKLPWPRSTDHRKSTVFQQALRQVTEAVL